MKTLARILLFAGMALSASAAENPVVLKNGKLSLTLPGTWKEAGDRAKQDEVLGAFQSTDNTSSLFVSTVTTQPDYSLLRVMDEVITNFEKGLIVNHIGKNKEGKLAGVFAVFCTLEIEVLSATTKERKPFRFYLTVFETGGVVYLIQGGTQQPLNEKREAEIMAIIRTVKSSGG